MSPPLNEPVPVADVWRQQQIAAAKPVTSKGTPFRPEELLGTNVRSPQDELLGSVENLVRSPQTYKIAYLVIALHGSFGIDEKNVPVPRENFKMTANANLLVRGSRIMFCRQGDPAENCGSYLTKSLGLFQHRKAAALGADRDTRHPHPLFCVQNSRRFKRRRKRLIHGVIAESSPNRTALFELLAAQLEDIPPAVELAVAMRPFEIVD